MKTEIKERSSSNHIVEFTFPDDTLVRIQANDLGEIIITYIDDKPMIQPKATNQILITANKS